MKTLIEIKASELNYGSRFWAKTKHGANGRKYQWCVADVNNGVPVAKVDATGEMFHPDPDDIVLIEEYTPEK
jgi:hypothetical protein